MARFANETRPNEQLKKMEVSDLISSCTLTTWIEPHACWKSDLLSQYAIKFTLPRIEFWKHYVPVYSAMGLVVSITCTIGVLVMSACVIIIFYHFHIDKKSKLEQERWKLYIIAALDKLKKQIFGSQPMNDDRLCDFCNEHNAKYSLHVTRDGRKLVHHICGKPNCFQYHINFVTDRFDYVTLYNDHHFLDMKKFMEEMEFRGPLANLNKQLHCKQDVLTRPSYPILTEISWDYPEMKSPIDKSRTNYVLHASDVVDDPNAPLLSTPPDEYEEVDDGYENTLYYEPAEWEKQVQEQMRKMQELENSSYEEEKEL